MTRARIRALIPGTLLLTLLSAGAASAQSTGPKAQAGVAQPTGAKAQLGVDDVQLAWCLDFLLDPALSGHLLPRGWAGTPAGSVSGLPTGLTRTFDEDAKYKSWFPGRICGISARAANVSGTTVVNDKARRPPTIAWLQIASVHGEGGPAYVQPTLATNTFRIRNPLNALTVKLDDMNFETGPDPDHDQPDDGFLAKIDGASISWKGYLSPDTLTAATADTLDAVYQNYVEKGWRVRVIRSGGTANRVAGLVGVVGKGDLAAALKASPIRLMSRVQTGGTAAVSFRDLP